MSLKYQLVLQWPASSLEDYDDMIDVEQTLIDHLGNVASVDGHDAGSGEVNIFLHTDHPKLAFQEINRILGSRDFLVDLKAAFRERNSNDYQVIWPPDLKSFSIS